MLIRRFTLIACLALCIASAPIAHAQAQTVEAAPEAPAAPTLVERAGLKPVSDDVFKPEPKATKIVIINHLDPSDLVPIVTAAGVEVTVAEKPKALVLSGTSQAISMAEAAIQQLDVAPKAKDNVEVVVYLVSTAQEAPESMANPVNLDAALKQVRELFSVANFVLLDTAVIRGRDGSSVEATGVLSGQSTDATKGTQGISTWRVQIPQIGVYRSENGVARISLDGFNVKAEVPTVTNVVQGQLTRQAVQFREVGLEADVDITEHQYAVVGKANMTHSGDPVFVVVQAWPVEE